MTESSSALTTTTQQPAPATLAFLHDTGAFEHLYRVAKAFSMSKMVPPHFQGKPEDCMVALMMSQQLNVDALQCIQNIQVINGRPGFSASYAIGLANTRGPFAGPITWSSKGKGEGLEVTAHAIVKSTGEQVSVTVNMEMAKAEGWVKNPKYRSIPEQMLRYRSATWLIRLHCPEVLLGLSTDEEIGGAVQAVTVADQTPSKPATTVDDLNAQIRKQVQEPAAEVEDEAVVDVEPSDDPF